MEYQFTFVVGDTVTTPYGTEGFFKIVTDCPRNHVSLAVIDVNFNVLINSIQSTTYTEIFSSMKFML